MARRRRTPEGEYLGIMGYVRIMSEEGRADLAASYFAIAESYDRLAESSRAHRAKMDDWYPAGTKRTASRRANAHARQAAIYRATALAYAMQFGPVETEGRS